MESSRDIEPAPNDRLAAARELLTVRKGQDPAWPALAAAALFAVSALGFAVGAILAPSATLTHMQDQSH